MSLFIIVLILSLYSHYVLGCLLTLKSDLNGSVWLHTALDVSECEIQLMPCEGLPPKYLALRQVQYKWEVTLIDNTSFLMPTHSLLYTGDGGKVFISPKERNFAFCCENWRPFA